MLKISRAAFVERGLPLVLCVCVVIADQLSKGFIVRHFPVPDGSVIRDVFNNGVLQIIHVRNDVIAFSLGSSLPALVRPALFVGLPLAVLFLLVIYYFKSNDWTRLQRWAIAGIVGGGVGNIIDRIFPPGGRIGVVDFISVRFYGIFGFERWPTFNVADSAVVVCVILWVVAIFCGGVKQGSDE
ncbi:MAG: signal peptidase II [Spirochaetaceae bacterium]|jgi:signal peptidase II|nr:signal peptidase II [Spirochaetaceae bacterium]